MLVLDIQIKTTMDRFYLLGIRKKERKLLEKAGFVQSGNSALAPIASTFATVLTFTCHILLRRKLTAPVVSASLELASSEPNPAKCQMGSSSPPLPLANRKNLLESTGNSTQYSVVTYLGKGTEKEWIRV